MNFILGLVANNMKWVKYLAVLVVVVGLFFWGKHSFYVWHTEPLKEYEELVKDLKADLNTSRAETLLCKSKKKNEVFEASNTAKAESIEQIIKEARYEEEINDFNGSDVDFSWMF